MKNFGASALLALVGSSTAFAAVPYVAPRTTPLYDDFSSGLVDTNVWFAANKNWGGKDKLTGEDYNGGVVPQNLYVRDGVLQCEAHGNLYEGDIPGILKNGSAREDGKRVGACAVTKDYFASGSYEIRAKVAPSTGVCCTMWTFEYEELNPGEEGFKGHEDYYVVNHEIDIEMPGRPAGPHENISYEYALCNTWVGEWDEEYTTGYTKLATRQDDGNFHTYRFDWHTGGTDPVTGTNIPKRVDFYFDGVLTRTNTTHIPTKAGRLWVGAWFPNGWAGAPEFESDVFQIDYVKITPFNEPGDEPAHETYGSDGLATPLNIIPPRSWKVGARDPNDVKAYLYDDGTLSFVGRGDVRDYGEAGAPWLAYASEITAVKFTIGVELQEHTLDGLAGLTTINGGPLSTQNSTAGYVFYDDFSSDTVDPRKWFAAGRNFDSWHAYYSGGVVPANLYVRDGVLRCEAHGDDYDGDIVGYDEGGNTRATRVGACAVTRDYFASGRYEIRAKVAPVKGVCCAMWTYEFETEEYLEEDRLKSRELLQEIDMRLPGHPADAAEDVRYDYVMCNTLTGKGKYDCQKSNAKLSALQNDGQFHVYRFDWHTGNKSGTIAPRVEFYVDGVLVQTNTEHIPTKAGRLWVGAWFPQDLVGTPDFDTCIFEVDYVRITPFHEENDEAANEQTPYSALLEPLNEVQPPLWPVGSPLATDVMARLNTNGVLVLSGKGAVTEFDSPADAPWASEAASVTDLVVRSGITEIQAHSLTGLYNLNTVNGTELSRYRQVLSAAGLTDPYAGSGSAVPTDVTTRLYQSTDLINWAPVNAPITLGADGKSVTVPVADESKQGFYKFVTE